MFSNIRTEDVTFVKLSQIPSVHFSNCLITRLLVALHPYEFIREQKAEYRNIDLSFASEQQIKFKFFHDFFILLISGVKIRYNIPINTQH